LHDKHHTLNSRVTKSKLPPLQKAVIVGGSSGIGSELALLLARHQVKTGIIARRENLLQQLARQSPQIIYECGDITNHSETTAKLERLTDRLDGVDLIVLSAGFGEENALLDFDLERSMIELNVLAFTAVADWAFNYFLSKGRGHLVVISSIAGLRGLRQAPAYSASKAFQQNYCEALLQRAKKLKLPILVTDVRPGFVASGRTGEGRFWEADTNKAAKQIYSAIKRRTTVTYITKRWLLVGWLLKVMPAFLWKRL
jgi:short-subunit dehydrogenase